MLLAMISGNKIGQAMTGTTFMLTLGIMTAISIPYMGMSAVMHMPVSTDKAHLLVKVQAKIKADTNVVHQTWIGHQLIIARGLGPHTGMTDLDDVLHMWNMRDQGQVPRAHYLQIWTVVD